MQFISLGYVAVTAAGTPVSLASVMAALSATKDPTLAALLASGSLLVNEIRAVPLSGNTGVTYIGLDPSASTFAGSGTKFVKATGVNVLQPVLPPSSAAGHNDSFCLQAEGQANTIRAADFAIDAANSGEGLAVWAVRR